MFTAHRESLRIDDADGSLLPEENEAQVARFLAGHADFRPLPIAAAWAESVGGAPPAGAGESLTLRPELHGTDGFFVAILERAAPEAAA
ncbi:MAG TPA: hypothetical protein PKW11_10645 [Pseudomonadota bacterium]|nr:hypothetical protein [Pseudomonadota bacterium]